MIVIITNIKMQRVENCVLTVRMREKESSGTRCVTAFLIDPSVDGPRL